ncbi:hypothetical protein FIU09_19600 [Stenotrophomonas maltophilia]|nr:hypothetical protein AVW14_10040 [Stenotrophomonas maltophilia]TNX96116.1 hypothetical protein FIU09_19600 [Stenotrophomonas maltophilia]TPD77741.1 hypothetical protein FJN19_19805 [Stenotrophomonas maltophilia]TPD78551.1 hypothetical protein FJN21_08300 [Stenotrophomonas maltophilia]TPD81982.1 hypothetical protein FJN20_12195 [Stenotrophomonas maltophilia]
MLSEPSWVVRGKTTRGLIDELMTFDDLDMHVEISVDGGDTVLPISLVGQDERECVLFYFGADV